jgi:tartrate dehydrogenase/decarboxylase/D-malate dehydrogenase
MLAAVLLLEHVGQGEAARRLSLAVEGAIADPAVRTPDLGGSGTTQSFTDRVVALARA